MELTNSQRVAAALERSTDALTRIADSVDLNAYQQGYHDGVRDEAPDMSAALEAEYQRGRADGARQQREADKRNLANSVSFNAATALSGYPLVTATSDQGLPRLGDALPHGFPGERQRVAGVGGENYGDGPQ